MTDPRPYRLPIDFVGGPADGRRHVSYPFPDVMPIHDPAHSEPAVISDPPPTSAPMPRIGIYRLARYGYGDGRGARFVYRWEGWQ